MADYSAFPVRIALVFKVCCASECFNGKCSNFLMLSSPRLRNCIGEGICSDIL